jgi:hypothetical protein
MAEMSLRDPDTLKKVKDVVISVLVTHGPMRLVTDHESAFSFDDGGDWVSLSFFGVGIAEDPLEVGGHRFHAERYDTIPSFNREVPDDYDTVTLASFANRGLWFAVSTACKEAYDIHFQGLWESEMFEVNYGLDEDKL